MLADIVIIGGGIVGTAIFHTITKHLPLRTILIESDRFGSGSTSKSGGIIRVYHSDEVLANLAAEGFLYYRRFTEEVGGLCGYQKTGVIYVEDDVYENKVINEIQRLKATYGIEIDVFDNQQLRRKFPALEWSNITSAVYEAHGGYIDPIMTACAWVDAGRRLGGTAIEGLAAQRVIVRNGRVVGIDTTQGMISCTMVIVAAGAWSSKIAEQLGITIPIRSKRIAAHAFHDVASENELPAFINQRTGLYGRPIGGRAMLMGLPIDSWDVPLDNNTDDIDKHSMADAALHMARQQFPQLANMHPWGGRYSFDGYSPDRRGILAFLPEVSAVLLAAGWSGGGVKIAPAIAKQVISILIQNGTI